MKRIPILIAVAALALGACASDGGASDDETSESLPVNDLPSSASEETPIPVEPNEGIGDGADPLGEPVVSPSLAGVVDLAVADLASRLDDDVLIEVVVAHELTWPDGSLGCARPDMAYTQALVEGYRIQLSDGDATYDYHGAIGELPFLCVGMPTDGSASEGTEETADPAAEGPEEAVESTTAVASRSAIVTAAVEDLAARMGLDPEDIAVVSHRAVVWPDSSLGCPSKGISYAQVLTPGTLTVLEANGLGFRYHSGAQGSAFICLAPSDPVGGD